MATHDRFTWAALACVLVGWFFLNSLVATFGPIRHAVHFYELAPVMRDPSRLVLGLRGTFGLSKFLFGVVCLTVLLAPVLADQLAAGRSPPMRYVMHAAPLLLMLLCGIVLWVKSSTTHIEAGPSLGRVGGWLAGFANSAQSWTGDVVARHIAIGAGGAVSFVASSYLAIRGVFRRCHTSVTRAP